MFGLNLWYIPLNLIDLLWRVLTSRDFWYDVIYPVGGLVVAFLILWIALTLNAKVEAIYTCEDVTYRPMFNGLFDPETIEAPEWCER